MAPPRKRSSSRSKRDYQAAYARRDARARAEGFASYYDKRVRKSVDAPAVSGELLRRRRGHASGADLRRGARDGDLVIASLGGRRRDGKYSRVDVTIVGADGGDQSYTLRGPQLRKGYVQRLVGDLEAAGVIFSPAPSLDLRRIGSEAS